jgi:hypothetical protein
MDSICQQFDISLSAFISHPGADDNPRLKIPIIPLGSLEDIATRARSCHLCRLIHDAYRSGPLHPLIGLVDANLIAMFGTWISALGPSKEQRLGSLALCLIVWPESPRIRPGAYKIIVRAASTAFFKQPHFGRLHNAETLLLNFKEIKSWLKHCENRHKDCIAAAKDAKPRPTKYFVVIDVRSRCLVKAPSYCRYLALSYVWGSAVQLSVGKENVAVYSREGALRANLLPKTINDALLLTQALGERYLWVDALCIIQDDIVVRRQSIEDMDCIYAQALCTIVAGAGNSANEHLQGVSLPRQRVQYVHKVSRELTLSAHFDYKDHLEGATYSQRAWT